MPPTRRDLQRQAAETGFEAASLEKVARLEEMLSEISGHPRLGSRLVLKGGTALNMFFGPPARLSVDLDLNYVGELDRSAMLEERPRIEGDIERVARSRGYGVQRSRDAHASRTFYLSYSRTVDTLSDHIKIDVNFVHRQCLLRPERGTMWNPFVSESVTFPVLAFDELAAGKIAALLDRAVPRDAWDVTRLPRIAEGAWPTERSRSIFIAFAGTLPHPLYSYTERGLERITDADVRRQLHSMLVSGEKPGAERLREDAWRVVAPFLDLTADEREYCERLQRGELCPELLFPEDSEIVDRVAVYPALLWKAKNAREFVTRESDQAEEAVE